MKRIAENTNYGEEFNNNLLPRETPIREICGKFRNRLRIYSSTSNYDEIICSNVHFSRTTRRVIKCLILSRFRGNTRGILMRVFY